MTVVLHNGAAPPEHRRGSALRDDQATGDRLRLRVWLRARVRVRVRVRVQVRLRVRLRVQVRLRVRLSGA
ncbi:hypothetical protein GCM10022261_06380 [Brevibacterium daeguense]|uniref:Uncharacterized protein n=1 Tax=Brevibacterium daeguense TaxID=909936 RepID=A0ABP8EGM6_9MICO